MAWCPVCLHIYTPSFSFVINLPTHTAENNVDSFRDIHLGQGHWRSELNQVGNCQLEADEKIYTRLQNRFASGVTQTLEYRTYNLKQLAYLIKDNEEKIQECLRKDLDRGEFDTSMSEVSHSKVKVKDVADGRYFPYSVRLNLLSRNFQVGWKMKEGYGMLVCSSKLWVRFAAGIWLMEGPKVMRQPKGVSLVSFPFQHCGTSWQIDHQSLGSVFGPTSLLMANDRISHGCAPSHLSWTLSQLAVRSS